MSIVQCRLFLVSQLLHLVLTCSFIPYIFMGFPSGSVGKELACSAGDPGLIPGLGRYTGEGIGCPLQYSWAFLVAQLVKNLPALQDTWIGKITWTRERLPIPDYGLKSSAEYIVHWVSKNWTQMSDFHFHNK